MTTVALVPLISAGLLFGATLTWPVAHRAGRRSLRRDEADVDRIRAGLQAMAPLELPSPKTATPELLLIVRSAAPPPEIDWHRGEHRIWSLGWAVEVLARLVSIGYKPPVLPTVVGRHRLGVAAGRQSQQDLWNSPTGQFWLIVAAMNDLDEPCTHCSTPEDGERPHFGCPGCACPCGTAEPLPDGVDGYMIAGRTR